nr:hypothetical protein [Saccharothrix sp. ALI-22-I]
MEAHGTSRDKTFAEKVSTRVRVCPEFGAALEMCRQIRARTWRCSPDRCPASSTTAIPPRALISTKRERAVRV